MISPAGFQEGFPPGDFLFTEHSPRPRLIRRALALQNQDGFVPASSELTLHGSLMDSSRQFAPASPVVPPVPEETA